MVIDMRVLWLSLAASLLLAQTSPELELKSAMHKEQVQGDLKGAIATYQKVIEKYPKNRAVVARALFQMAECHQKAGDLEARKIYERIVREYPDQNETAGAARARLAPPSATLNMRQIMTTTGKGVSVESVTADGRVACASDWSNGDLLLRDMSTGAIRRILPGSLEARTLGASRGIGSYVGWCVISPDQKQIAFTRYLPEERDTHQLWVISTEPGAKPRQVTNNPRLDNIHTQGWSQDSKYVFAKIQRVGEAGDQIVRISIADGAVRVIKSFALRQYLDYWLKLSPDGRFIAYSAAPSPASANRSIYVVAADGSSENVVSTTAGINEQPVWTPDGSRILFISDRTGTFDLWAIRMLDGKAVGEPSLVKRDLGRIQNMGMTHSGTYFYGSKSTLGRTEVALLKPPVRKLESLVGIRPNLSPDGTAVAVLRRRPASPGATDVILRSLETGEEKILSRNGIVALIGWYPDGKGVLTAVHTNDPYERAYYRANVATGQFQKIWDYDPKLFLDAMVAISSNSQTMYVAGKDFWEYSYGDMPIPVDFGFNRLWKRDLLTGKQTLMFTLPETANIVIDSLQISPDGKRLALIIENRALHKDHREGRRLITVATDGSGASTVYSDHSQALSAVAWSEDSQTLFFGRREVNNTWHILSIPASGGTPAATGLSTQTRNLSISTNGTRMAFGGIIQVDEMWALENVLAGLK